MLDNQKIYGLVGFPLGHSFSRDFFNQKFEAEGINAAYVNFEIPSISQFKSITEENLNLCGLNVTIPYKEQVIPYLDSLDDAAKEIGAVNVVKFIRGYNGELLSLKGYNSDYIGFCDSIAPLLKPEHKKALVLGTGGASKAVMYGLKKLGIEPTLVSRTAAPGRYTYEQLTPKVISNHTVIVNTTPLGMHPHTDECPDISYQLLSARHLCYDLIYNPETTLFMKKSAEHGATTKSGLEMLHRQAIAAWKIWNSSSSIS